MGDSEKGLAGFGQALALNPDLAAPHFGRALILLAQDEVEAADAEMEQLWLQHTVPEMHRHYARLLEQTARQLRRQGRKEDSKRYREKALGLGAFR